MRSIFQLDEDPPKPGVKGGPEANGASEEKAAETRISVEAVQPDNAPSAAVSKAEQAPSPRPAKSHDSYISLHLADAPVEGPNSPRAIPPASEIAEFANSSPTERVSHRMFPELDGAMEGTGWAIDASETITASSTRFFPELATADTGGEWIVNPYQAAAKYAERIFPQLALGGNTLGTSETWILDPVVRPPEPHELFELQIGGKLPEVRNLASSVVVHAVVITLMMTIKFPAPEIVATQQEPQVTEIRIGQHLYYLTDLSGAEKGRASAKKNLPRAASVGTAGAPTAAVPSKREPAPSAAPIPAPAIQVPDANAPEVLKAAAAAASAAEREAARQEAAQTEAARRAAQKALVKTFIPPEVKRSATSTQTLIQPLSPPDLVPPPTPLPSFRVVTPQFPKLSRRFVAPGRTTERPPAPTPQVETPDIQLAQVTPVDVSTQPKLTLPVAPPPPSPEKPAPTPAPPATGDSINILSLNDRNIPLTDRVVVPAGNIAQESVAEGNTTTPRSGAASTPAAAGGAAANGGGARAASGAATSAGAPTTSSSAAPGNGAAPSGTGPANSRGTSPAPALANTAPRGSGLGNAPEARPGAGAGSAPDGGNSNNAKSNGAGAAPEGTGRGTVGSGTGSALAGGSATGNPELTVGGTGTGSGGRGTGGGGTSNGSGGNGQGAGIPGLIMRSPNGTFDAVVVQTSPLDQYPESRGLLTGRPIYSVYVSVGTARDWTLYYCIPNEHPPQDNSNVIQLGTAQPAQVKAPYPFKLLRPQTKLPSWAKYVLVHGYVNADGKFEGMKVVRSVLPEIDRSVLSALTEWEFRAATRDNSPVMVEVLLSIPAAGI